MIKEKLLKMILLQKHCLKSIKCCLIITAQFIPSASSTEVIHNLISPQILQYEMHKT